MVGRVGVVVLGFMVGVGCGQTSSTPANTGGGGGGSGTGGSAAASSGGALPGGGSAGAPNGGVSALGGAGATGSGGATGGMPGSGGTGGSMLPPSDKLDLLFVIDNSASMAHNQALMSGSIPALIDRLLDPDCVDPSGTHSAGVTPCPSGGRREFAPVADLHVGVVTSSIGGHGADLCSPASSNFDATQDDHAHLLPSVRTGLTSFNGLGFLAWNPSASAPSGSIGDPAVLTQLATGEVDAAGETGCGVEGTLEAMYRFLVDPEPPLDVTVSNGQAVVSGPDPTVLQQRRDFLRPDSAVGIVVLSDENDCSIVDGGIGWIVASSVVGTRQFHMPVPTSTCATDPNSPCCRSCGVREITPPTGCVPLAQDSGCQTASTSLSAAQDPLNLRCWNQKRRFGLDLLNPVQRYITGLASPTIQNRAGQSVLNPLFYDASTGTQRRDASRVFLLGVVGVPWQDVATPASLTGTGLEYLTSQQLRDLGRWSVILGDDTVTPPVLPGDALMVESETPRTGTSPIAGVPLAAATSLDPQQNRINGHEYTPSPTAGDLQYACIYRFATPVVCTADNPACDCVPDTDGGITAIQAANRPLCQPPGGGAPGTTQYWGKAYPAIRELQLLRGLGDRGIVASLCAKSTTDASDPIFGFKPAFDALVDRMGPTLVGP